MTINEGKTSYPFMPSRPTHSSKKAQSSSCSGPDSEVTVLVLWETEVSISVWGNPRIWRLPSLDQSVHVYFHWPPCPFLDLLAQYDKEPEWAESEARNRWATITTGFRLQHACFVASPICRDNQKVNLQEVTAGSHSIAKALKEKSSFLRSRKSLVLL